MTGMCPQCGRTVEHVAQLSVKLIRLNCCSHAEVHTRAQSVSYFFSFMHALIIK